MEEGPPWIRLLLALFLLRGWAGVKLGAVGFSLWCAGGLLVHPTVEHPQTDEKETDLDEGPGKDLEGARPLTAL